jgi:hypothetical protein
MSYAQRQSGWRMSGSRDWRPATCRVLLVLWCLPVSGWAAQYGGGNGTVEKPYLIYTPEDFCTIGRTPADWGKHFKQMRDIDLSAYDEKNLTLIGRWTGKGDATDQPFQGSYDGNGKTITNFHYKDTHQDYIALFRCVSGEVRNVRLLHARVVGNQGATAALVAWLVRGAVVNCSVTDAVVSGNQGVGGLIGMSDGGVSKCSARGRVAGILYVGGLIGEIGDGSVVQSYSKAEVVGNEGVGGLVGITTGDTAVVDSCYATGKVDGAKYVGGLVGETAQGTVFRCYATGRVTGVSAVGGLVGKTWVLGQVFGGLWDMESSGQTTSSGGVGKTTNEMRSIDTYLVTNWDFNTTWTICEGIHYPVLVWQIPPGDVACPDGVALSDFAWFAQNWWHDDCTALNWNCDGADLDGSGSVGYLDLAIFAENWLVGTD